MDIIDAIHKVTESVVLVIIMWLFLHVSTFQNFRFFLFFLLFFSFSPNSFSWHNFHKALSTTKCCHVEPIVSKTFLQQADIVRKLPFLFSFIYHLIIICFSIFLDWWCKGIVALKLGPKKKNNFQSWQDWKRNCIEDL